MSQPFLISGLQSHTHARLDSYEEVKRFTQMLNAYFRVEQRSAQVQSSLEILRQIQEMTKLQVQLRSAVIAGCGIILALIIGTIAWLEFNQESYLSALLRSFGVPSIFLFIHSLFENLVLVLMGVGISLWGWPSLYSQISQQSPLLQGLDPSSLIVPKDDLFVLLSFAIAGVVLALLPILIGLRRQPGHILQ